MHHAWSKLGHTYTGDELKDHLVKNIFPYEVKQRIPSVPSVNLPTRQKTLTFTLGHVSHDVKSINDKAQIIGDELKEKAEDRQDVDENFQVITTPTIDENFVGQRIQVKFKMDELDDVTGGKKLI